MDVADDDQENDSRVDELIDRGLERYGNGELAAALADWKHAQALSPTCDRVREYIKLVESHYELSSSNEIEDGNDAEDGEELTIDRSLNSAPPSTDQGWDIDDDWSDDDTAGQADSNDDPVESLDRIEDSLPEDMLETPMVTLREMSFEEEDAQAGRSVERNSQQQSVVSGEITSGASLGGEARAPITPESSMDAEDEPTKSFYLPELVDAGIELERVGNSAPAEAGELEQTQNVVRNFRDPEFELEISDDSDSASESEVPKSERGTLELAPLDLGGISSSAQQRPEPSPPSGLSFDDELTNFHVSLNSQDVELSRDSSSSESSSSESSSSESSSSGPDPRAQRTQSRSPTVDPELSTMTMDDEGQLSFEDATRELDLNAMEMGPSQGNTAGRSDPETLDLEPEDATKQLDLRAMDLGPAPARNKDEDDEDVPPKLDHDDVQSGRIDLGLSEDEMSDLQIGDSPTGATTNGILAEISAEAPSSGSERTSYIVNRLIKHTVEMTDEGSYKEGASSSMYALEYADDNAVAQKLVVENERQLIRALVFGLGDLSEIPRLLLPMTEIPFDDIDHRAAFLLTRMDGALTLEEILDVSGMPRLEALRHLTRLHTKGYLVVE